MQFVFHLAANLHQLVPMQHQLPQIALLPVRSPQPRKPPLNPQPQNVRRVPLVRLLLAHLAGSHLRRIADPDLVPQILDPLDQPLTVPRGFHTNHPLLIKHFAVTVGMYQLPFPAIPCLAIQPTYLLPAGMEITSFFPASLSSNQDYRVNRAFALIQSVQAQLWGEFGLRARRTPKRYP